MKRLNLKTTAEASRKDSYTMNLEDINIYWELNERTGETYDDEEYFQLEALIEKDMEIHHPIFIMPDENVPGKWRLEHGYRRARAIKNLRAKGVIIEAVPVKQIYSHEDAMLLHITLNNSTKSMNKVQLAALLRKYAKATQNDSPKFLSEKTGLPINMISTLLGFDELASTVLKQAVTSDEISFTTAAEIAQNSSGITEQNEILSEGKKEAQRAGKKKITNTIVAKVTGKTKVNKELSRLRSLLCMNGNYSEVVRLIDNMGIESDASLLSILKQQEVEA